MPQRKRKKSNVSPNIEGKRTSKRTKDKMADNTSIQGTPQGNTQGSQYVVPPIPPMYPQSSPYYMNMNNMNNMSMNPTSPLMNQQGVNNDVLQTILTRLNTMDSKLNQLSSIQTSVNKITERLNAMESKISEIESGQKFVSDQYESLTSKTKSAEKNIDEIRSEVKSLAEENIKLKASNNSLTEDVIDLKCRSMRDNLLFFGISEQTRIPNSDVDRGMTPGNPTYHPEDCAERVFEFCKDVLKIDAPKDNLFIDRAHRIGQFRSGKTRPIVVKFKDTASKLTVQNTLKTVNLRDTPFNVSEQYPQEIKDRRKELIPIMLQARRDGKKAVLVRDKLFINNVLYSSDPTAPH